MSFHVTLTSEKNNSVGGLKIQFAKPFRLRGEWEVAIVNWFSDNVEDDSNLVWVFCDLVEYSATDNIPMQLLGIEHDTRKKYYKPMYVRLCKKMFSSINIQFKHGYTTQEPDKIKNVTCILHFRKA
jgi:hypothetical protein